jgi:hypothetical protein
VVILSVKDKTELLNALAKARHKGIKCYTFTDSDLSEELNPTSFATEPVGRIHAFSKYTLWKPP